MFLASCRAQRGAVAGVIQSRAVLRHSPVTAGEPLPGSFSSSISIRTGAPRAPSWRSLLFSLNSLLRDSRELTAKHLFSLHDHRHCVPLVKAK
jgi:hypothetical protein